MQVDSAVLVAANAALSGRVTVDGRTTVLGNGEATWIRELFGSNGLRRPACRKTFSIEEDVLVWLTNHPKKLGHLYHAILSHVLVSGRTTRTDDAKKRH